MRWLQRLGDRIVGRKRSLVVLIIGVFSIGWWQWGVGGDSLERRADRSYAGRSNLKAVPKYQVTAARGAMNEQSFFFLYYHLGLYPLASDIPPKKDTLEEAQRLMEFPQRLKQEEGLTFRSGEHGRIHLYWVDAWIKHRGLDPSLRPATALGFVLSLALLFVAAWWIDRPVLGALLVALLGSQTMQIHAVYREENFFAWPITTACLLLAIHLPLLTDKPPKRWIWIAPVLAGIVIASVRTIRSEPGILVLSAIGTYLFLRRVKFGRKLAAIAILFVTMSAGDAAYKAAIRSKMAESRAALIAAGGNPYDGPTVYHHEFWHAIWCGLGDFGQDHGYRWDDHAAYRSIIPDLERTAGHPFDIDTKGWFTKSWYGENPRYRVGIWELPGYDEAARDQVLRDIRAHPAWYLGVLWKRAKRIATENTPFQIVWEGGRWTDEDVSPYLGMGCVPLLLWSLVRKRWFWTKLLLFTTPLSIPAFAVYSGAGITNYTCFHLVGAVIFIVAFFEGVLRFVRRT